MNTLFIMQLRREPYCWMVLVMVFVLEWREKVISCKLQATGLGLKNCQRLTVNHQQSLHRAEPISTTKVSNNLLITQPLVFYRQPVQEFQKQNISVARVV